MKRVEDSEEFQKVLKEVKERKLIDQFSYSRPETNVREGLREVLDLRYEEVNKVMHSNFRDRKQSKRFALYKAYNAAENDSDINTFCDVFEEAYLDANAAIEGEWNKLYAKILNQYAGMQQEIEMAGEKEMITGGATSKFKQFLSRIF